MKFVGIMALVALIGFIIEVPMLIKLNTDVKTFIDRSLNLIVIAVPPALPAAVSCGVVFAINRLKNQKIFCISPPRVKMVFLFLDLDVLTHKLKKIKNLNLKTTNLQLKTYKNLHPGGKVKNKINLGRRIKLYS
jgi:hypothetical protein